MVSGSKSDSRIKKNKQQGLTLAKDPKQAILAVVVIVLFIITSIHAVIQSKQGQEIRQQDISKPIETPLDLENESPDSSTVASDPSSGAVVPSPDEPLSGQAPGAGSDPNLAQDANNIYSQTVGLQKTQPNARLKQEHLSMGNVEILPQKKGKMVSIVVANSGRMDPFLPPSEFETTTSSYKKPPSFPYLTPPPETLQVSSDAGKIMTTVISGILYDKYSPSAIINIEGTDYLVKKGDIVNRYKVLSISKTQVVVQLGKNVYQAGVGQLLSPTSLNQNAIANLNKKFGGNNVSIRVKKKG